MEVPFQHATRSSPALAGTPDGSQSSIRPFLLGASIRRKGGKTKVQASEENRGEPREGRSFRVATLQGVVRSWKLTRSDGNERRQGAFLSEPEPGALILFRQVQ